MLLSEFELIRSRHAAKLAELEDEYLIQKKEPRRQTRKASKGEDLGLNEIGVGQATEPTIQTSPSDLSWRLSRPLSRSMRLSSIDISAKN
jgi:hypothetical protein